MAPGSRARGFGSGRPDDRRSAEGVAKTFGIQVYSRINIDVTKWFWRRFHRPAPFLGTIRKQCLSDTVVSFPFSRWQRRGACGEPDSFSARSHFARCPSQPWFCLVYFSRAPACCLSCSLTVLALPGRNGSGFSPPRRSECPSYSSFSSKGSPSRRFRTLL